MADLNVKVGLDRSGFQTGLAAMENAVSGFGNKLTGILAGSFSFAAIGAGISKAIEKGDQLQDIAEKFGVSASKLQMLGNAASVYGSSIENVSMGLNKLSLSQQKAVDGDEGLQKTFEEVGIKLTELENMAPEDIFLRIADSFASGANDGRQFLIINDLLGKAQTDLIKVMNQGSAAIIEQGTAIGVWSDETIAALSRASDAIKTLQNTLTIGFGYVVPVLENIIQRYQKLVESVTVDIAAIFGPGLDRQSRKELMAESDRLLKQAVGPAEAEQNATQATVRATDRRIQEYDREAKAKESSAERWKKAMESMQDLDAKEEIAAGRIENRALIREAQRLRDATPGSEAFEKERMERLRLENALRGNDANFDPREALIRRMDSGAQGGLTPAAMQDPVSNTTVQSIAGKIDTAIARLEDIVRKAGSFS